MNRIRWSMVEAPVLPAELVGSPAWNMALDAWLVNRTGANGATAMARLYHWPRPAVTVGRFQNPLRTMDVDACAQLRIDIGRRLTGGRGILHGDDLTVCVAANVIDFRIEKHCNITSIYQEVTRFLMAAFASIDIPTMPGVFNPGDRGERGDCFASVSQADLIERDSGAKLVGAALYRTGNRILLQCSIPIYNDTETMGALSHRVFRGGRPRVPNIARQGIDGDKLSQAIVNALSMQFQSDPDLGILSESEVADVLEIVPEHIVPMPSLP